MSEANLPEKDGRPPQEAGGASWFTGWDDFLTEPAAEQSPPIAPSPQAADSQSWHTVNFPNAISVDAIDRQSLYNNQDSQEAWAHRAAPQPSVQPPLGTGKTAFPHANARLDTLSATDEQPRMEDLVSLIQELNQCNHALLDRVAQLEEALEQAQINANGGGSSSAAVDGEPALDAATHRKITQLLNEIEFAGQTNQRQKQVIDRLNEQLNTHKERVAQLERDCALIQKNYNQQAQQLQQSEATCADLRVRLQRQQHYTIQFKAALEKCLEGAPLPVSSVPSEITPALIKRSPRWQDPIAPFNAPPLPRSPRIQPWSAQGQPALTNKLNLLSVSDASPDLRPIDDPTPGDRADSVTASEDASMDALAADLQNLELAPVEESTIQSPIRAINFAGAIAPQPAIPSQPATEESPSEASSSEKTPEEAASEEAASKQPQPEQQTLESQPTISFDLTSTTPTEAPIEATSELPPEVLQAGLSELQALLGDFWDEQMPDIDKPDDQFWHDLAKLIDISADDLLKASLSNDFSAFEEKDSVPVSEEPIDRDRPTVAEIPGAIAPDLEAEPFSLFNGESPATAPQDSSASSNPLANNPNWPSPLVRPLRPSKRISSLAAVDLPTFKPQEN